MLARLEKIARIFHLSNRHNLDTEEIAFCDYLATMQLGYWTKDNRFYSTT